MFQSAREQRITERINKLKKKPVRKAIKRVKRKSKVETTAQKKTALMLQILNDEKLKSGVKLERVFKMLNEK